MSGWNETIASLDGLLPGPVLVFGRPPPAGRDLDLLVAPGEDGALARALGELGFARGRRDWARFDGYGAEVVEVVPASAWGLPDDELRDLFAEAQPLPRSRNLRVPSPPHELLILARRRGKAPAEEKLVSRARWVSTGAPAAWGEAGRRAAAWGVSAPLAALRAEVDAPAGTASSSSARKLQHFGRIGRRLRRGVGSFIRPRGRLIALSGLDGAGKSTQAARLREALEQSGCEAVVVWSSIMISSRFLIGIKSLANVLLASRGAVAPSGGDGPSGDEQAPADHAKQLRKGSRATTLAWSSLVAVVSALRQSRGVRGHLRRGRVVICDRYTLDSAVHLRYEYGDERSYALQEALIRLLSPQPQLCFLLDLSPEEAFTRKPDYSLEYNHRKAALYRAESPRFGAVRLDATRPPEELSREIARKVWTGLG